MRCYACNTTIENGYDKKTDRNYCDPCFEWTNKVILKNLDAEMSTLFGDVPFLGIEEWVTDAEGLELEGEDARYED